MQKTRVLRAGGVATILVVLSALAIMAGSSAQAQTPGTNGVVFFDAGGNIHRTDPGVAGSTQIATGGAFASPDACHTDQNLVVFSSNTGIRWVENALSSPVVFGPLPGTDANSRFPVFNQDCSKVAYEQIAGTQGIHVRDFSSGGNALAPVIGTAPGTGALAAGARGQHPEWSPDGGRIYFSGDVDPGAPNVQQIFFVNATGGGQTAAVLSGAANCGQPGDTTTSCREPSISPDGNTLVFLRGNFDIAVAPVGGAVTTHAAGDGFDDEPDWSPDGAQIVVDAGGNELSLFSSNPAVSARTNWTPGPTNPTAPDWGKAAAAPTPTPGADTGTITGQVTQSASTGGGFGGLFGGLGGLFGGGASSSTPQPVSGATVSTGAGQTTTTDASGNYTIANVPAGNTSLTATAQVSSSSLFGGSSTQNVDCTVPGSSDTTANVTVPAGGTATQDFECPAASGGSGFGGLFGGGGFGGLGGLFGGGGFGGLGGLFGGIG